jgi:hypothetical protein
MNEWTQHLKAFRKAHPSLSLKEAMIKAKSTYKKGGRKRGGWSLPRLPDPKFQPVLRRHGAVASDGISYRNVLGGSSIIDGDQPNQLRRRIGRTPFRTLPVDRFTK